MFGKKKDVNRMEILNMLAEGLISANEASTILAKIEKGNADVIVEPRNEKIIIKEKKDYHKKMFRVIVDSADGDKVRVNIPIALAKSALKVTGNSNVNVGGVNLNEYGIDFDEIIKMIDEDLDGEIVNVESSDGDFVRIVID